MDIKETREEIIKRSVALKKKQRKQIKMVLEGTSVMLLALLIIVMRQVPFTRGLDSNASYYGTLLLGKEAGIFIIVGLICFILGVLITLITLKYREHDDEQDGGEEE